MKHYVLKVGKVLKNCLPYVLTFSCVMICSVDFCQAQNQNIAVQLPTVDVFAASTTVVVPDRGTASLGGSRSSNRGLNQFGFGAPGFGNRGIGRASSAGGISVNTTIIDHNEIDRALLAEAERRRAARLGANPATTPRWQSAAPSNRFSNRNLASNRVIPSTFRPALDRRAKTELSLSATYLDCARRSEADGQPQLAKMFYKRVIKRGTITQRKQAEQRIAQIEKSESVSRLRKP